MLEKLKKYYKNLSKKNKKQLPIVVGVFVVLFFTGVSMVLAFYNGAYSFPIISNKVGNFDNGNGDLAIVIYRQSNSLSDSTKEYKRVYGIPQVGFSLDHVDCTQTCTQNQSDACHYTYDVENNLYSLTSDKKVTCRFYYNKTAEADVEVSIMIEDENGGIVHEGKNYREIDSIPAFGYEYTGYYCAKAATVTYNQELKTFNVSTTTRNSCQAFFNKVNDSDITVNVFVQTALGGSIYQEVESIPTNKSYIISTNANYTTACYNSSGAKTGDTITYSGGYITVSATSKVSCNVYLDLYSGAPLINSLTATSTANSLVVTGDVTKGTNGLSCYKFKMDDVSDLSACQSTPTMTYSNLDSCTYYRITMYAVDDQGIQVGYTKSFKTTGC